MLYRISIREELERIVEVEAETPDEAWQKVSDDYYTGNIILDSGDYVDTVISYCD